MTDAPLFTMVQAAHAVIVTPLRNLTEFDFVEIEGEMGKVFGRASRTATRNIVVDFSRIDYCGSTALGFFTRLLKQTRHQGGELAFCNVSPGEKEVLHVTHLDTLWPICDSLDEAVQTVKEAAERRSNVTRIVVADRAIARVFDQCGGPDGELKVVTTMRHPESRERVSDVVSDRPGSFRGGAIAGSESGEPHRDHRHHTADEFAREVADHLNQSRLRREFDRLVLIAAPLFLGALRDALPNPLRLLVDHEIDKDYTHLDSERIREQLCIAVEPV